MTAILDAYRQLWTVTQDMVTAARAGEWETLTELDTARQPLFSWLAEHDLAKPATEAEAEAKRELLTQLVAAEKEVRTLATDWMAELRGLIGSVNNSRRLEGVYSKHEAER